MTEPGGWPEIPAVAWRRPMGLPCPDAGHPRVDVPMTDDGSFAGIPIGGLGTGSIGRTHRGDFARWHLEVGRHAFVWAIEEALERHSRTDATTSVALTANIGA